MTHRERRHASHLASASWPSHCNALPGTDAHAIGTWIERGLHGTQLGPNKHGHGW